MHLLETYSLNCAAKIDRAYILEKYYPLTVDKYITFQPFSKYNSKNYDYFYDVISILKPVLDKAGIHIVQVGGPDEKPIDGCYHTQGQTNFGQLAYIIKNGLLHLGADSVSVHIASHFEKKIVALYSNNHISCVKPYWGNPDDHVLLEPDRTNFKPTFSAEEHPKTINQIKPEKIAEAVCKQLGIPFDFPYETVCFGELYHVTRMVEMVPDVAINLNNLGTDSIIVRMDFKFDESILANQLFIANCHIVTNKPIDLQLLQKFAPRIKQLVYIIEHDNDPKFAATLAKSGLPFQMLSYLTEEELNRYKLDYLDIGLISHRQNLPRSLSETPYKDIPVEKLFYRSSKATLGRQKIYPSKAAWMTDKPMQGFTTAFHPIIDIPDFYQEIDYHHIVKLKD